MTRIRTTIAATLVGSLATAATALAQATETAEYRVEFIGTWTVESHPIDYPGSAHFSPLVGGTHAAADQLWMPGELASQGVEAVAETGFRGTLINEVNALIDAGDAEQLIEGPAGQVGPVATIPLELTVRQSHPYVSIITMIAPSPDWFVGTHDTSLFVDGEWVTELEVELQPYDAGTDSGVTYTSANENTFPRQPITEIIGYPVAEDGERANPFGIMRFTRLDTPICNGDLDDDGIVNGADLAGLLGAWGTPDADLDGDGTTSGADLSILLGNWGDCG